MCFDEFFLRILRAWWKCLMSNWITSKKKVPKDQHLSDSYTELIIKGRVGHGDPIIKYIPSDEWKKSWLYSDWNILYIRPFKKWSQIRESLLKKKSQFNVCFAKMMCANSTLCSLTIYCPQLLLYSMTFFLKHSIPLSFFSAIDK